MLTSTFCSPALIHPESAVLRKPIHRATCLRQKAFRLTFWSRDQRQPLVHQRATLVRATDKEEAEEQKIRNPLKPEQKKEEQSLGLVGTIITWGVLAVMYLDSRSLQLDI